MDESHPARGVTIADGRMTLDGIPAAYMQDLSRPLALQAEALQFVGGFGSGGGRLEDKRRIEAEARFVDGGLRRIGREGTATRLRLSLRPLATAAEEARLLLVIGWSEAQGEDRAFAEAFLPAAVFDTLKADLLARLADELVLRATMDLWIREADRERPADRPVDRYLAPQGEASAPARGFVETLEWRPTARAVPATPPAEASPTPAPEPAAAEADEGEETVDALGRINWSLRQLLVLMAFLLIILAIK